MELTALRERLTQLDRDLLSLIAERQRLSEEVARAKHATGHPTRDFQREREVLRNARAAAENLGLSPDLADSSTYAHPVPTRLGILVKDEAGLSLYGTSPSAE